MAEGSERLRRVARREPLRGGRRHERSGGAGVRGCGGPGVPGSGVAVCIPPELWAVELRRRFVALASDAMRSRRHRHLDPEDVAADVHIHVIREWERGLHPTLSSALDPAHHLGLLRALLQRMVRQGRRVCSRGDLAWVEAAPGDAPGDVPTGAEVLNARRMALHALLRVLHPPPTPDQLAVFECRQARRTWRDIVEATGWKKRKARDAYTRLVKRLERLRFGLESVLRRQLALREPLRAAPGPRRGWVPHRSGTAPHAPS